MKPETPLKTGQTRKSLRERGLTLLEASVALTVGAAIISGVLLALSTSSDRAKSFQASADVAVLRDTIRDLYLSQNSYANHTSANFRASNLIPNHMADPTKGSGMINPFGKGLTTGRYSVGCVNCYNAFQVSLWNLPNSNCASILGSANKSDAIQILTGQNAATLVTFNSPFDTAALIAACTATNQTSAIRYVFE